jgi:hypothetical protein
MREYDCASSEHGWGVDFVFIASFVLRAQSTGGSAVLPLCLVPCPCPAEDGARQPETARERLLSAALRSAHTSLVRTASAPLNAP